MKKHLLLSILVLGLSSACVLAATDSEAKPLATAAVAPLEAVSPVQAASGIIERLLPKHASQFVCEVIPADNGKDVFEIESKDGKVVLRGNNGVSIASALNWYLKYTCHCQVSWCGDQLNLPVLRTAEGPATLPPVTQNIRIVSPHKYRYAFNYCTFGYAMAFWDWKRWERELDFMALHGLNAPLGAVGAEVVYRNVYRDLGMDRKDIDSFIAAPPYLPWFLMSNIDGYGGAIADAWYDRQEALQKKILKRSRELGMTPILHAFGGHVPASLKNKFPQAKITKMKGWGGFPSVYVLDPGDPLFRDIGARFIRENIKLYGTDHLYSADTFNEMVPPSTDLNYLKNISTQVFASMNEADPKATWVMQGWLFLDMGGEHNMSGGFWNKPRARALLSGVPDDRMLLLEFFPDSKPVWSLTDAYFGKPWLCCIINSWGGKQGMYGRMNWVGKNLPGMLTNPAAGRVSGLGTLNEGNTINPIVFEQLYEMTWHDKPIDVPAWVRDYVHARYGKDNADAQKAWAILLDTLYNCKDNRHGPQGSFLSMIPTFSADGSGFARASIFYNTEKVRDAFRLLLNASDELGSLDTYRFDLVDVGRQVMSDISQQVLHKELRAALSSKDAARFDKAKEAYYQAILDQDTLLRSHRLFQLGYYLKFPKAAGSTEAENAQYERNARRLITRWGSNDHLHGYAQRQYGGLLADFNLKCWKALLEPASAALHNKKAFNKSAAVTNTIEQWIKERNAYPVEAEGDTIAAAKMIWEKYASKAKSVGDPKTTLEIKDKE